MNNSLDYILDSVAKLNLTAYEIGNATGLNVSGVQKILNKEVLKPRNATLMLIYDYVEKRLLGSAISGHENFNQKIHDELIIKESPTDYVPANSHIESLERIIKSQDEQIKFLKDQIDFLKFIIQGKNTEE